jgi:hypothetical protein
MADAELSGWKRGCHALGMEEIGDLHDDENP